MPSALPPATYSRDDESEYIALEQQWLQSIKAGELDRAKDVSQRQTAIGSPCFVFAHSVNTAEGPQMVYLHPQMMSDAKTAAEVCSLFFVNWQERAR